MYMQASWGGQRGQEEACMAIVHTHARIRGDPQDWENGDGCPGMEARKTDQTLVDDKVQTGSDLETCSTDHSLPELGQEWIREHQRTHRGKV